MSRIAFLAFALAMGSTNSYALQATDQKDTAYVGATVYDGTGTASRPDMVVVTRAGRIVAMLPASSYRAEKGTEAISVRGKFLIPGLFNSHVHLATFANPSAAKAYLLRELYSGVTAVRDMAGDVMS